MNVGDIFEVVPVYNVGSQYLMNRLHFIAYSIAGDAPDDQQAQVDGFSQEWLGHVNTVICEETAYLGMEWRRVDPDPLGKVTTTLGAGIGLREGPALPPQVSGLITFLPSDYRPRSRGRIFMPPTGPGDLATGTEHWTTDYKSDLEAFAADILDGVEVVYADGTVTFKYVWPSAGGSVWQQDSAVRVRRRPATQRRRSLINRGDPYPL